MEIVFIKLLNMSIAASWLVLAVIALRFFLKNAPKNIRRILWALVGIRLVLPFSPESFLSLIPSAETVSPNILYAEAPKIHSGISAFNTYVNPIISESLAPNVAASVNPMQVAAYIASAVWIIGMITLILYGVISYVGLRRKVAEAVPLRNNLWQSEAVASPFVLGFFHPRIYLPFGMDEESLAYVVAHEQAHLRRRDHWIKPIGFLLLSVYWFNPLIWLAYILLCRDIELACDERVVKQMSADDKKAYSKTLLTCSVDRRSIAACPLAFGEVGVKQRIKSVLNYKKPAFWIVVAALVSCVVAAVCFLTNPKAAVAYSADGNGVYTAGALLGQNGSLSYLPEDGSYYGQLILSHYSLSVINDEGQTIFENAGSMVSQMRRAALIDKLNEANIYGMEEIDVPEYDSLHDMMVYSYYVLNGEEKDIKYSIYWFNGQPKWFAEGEMLRIYELEPQKAVTAYVSQSCVYMNLLSSTFSDGDSGCRYLIGADSFTIINKQTGDIVAVSSTVSWDWQKISEAEWSTLFPLGMGAPDFSIYKNPQVMKLSSRYFLFDMDGELWFGDCRGGKVGMWSIYSLVPESTAGVTWEYTPELSSRVPAFPFRFNLAYTCIEAECTGGRLIGFDDHDGTGYPQGKTLTVPAGSALYWSPTPSDTDPAIALTSQISFTVYNGGEAVYTGAVSISRTTGTGSVAVQYNLCNLYNAVLSEGDGLILVQTPDADGALIQAAGTYSTSSVGGIGWPQHLTVAQGDLDGDGAAESVTVTKLADDLYVLSVLKVCGSELWSQEMST